MTFGEMTNVGSVRGYFDVMIITYGGVVIEFRGDGRDSVATFLSVLRSVHQRKMSRIERRRRGRDSLR